MVRSNERIKTR